MTIRICLAGATGWAGSALARAIGAADDLQLTAAVSRAHAGKKLGDVLGDARLTAPIYATAEEALLTPCDVFFEYTKPDVAKKNALHALAQHADVVIGTSGLTAEDYAEIEAAAKEQKRGVLAVGNFALTVVLMSKFAEIAARYIPQSEIIDYASDGKIDAPSGTARELAFRLSNVRESQLTIPLDKTQGEVAARGARLNGTQVHSLRLPGYTLATEVIFGMPDQRLVMRAEPGSSAEPYVDGALLAIRKVGTFTGLWRGLDSVMEL